MAFPKRSPAPEPKVARDSPVTVAKIAALKVSQNHCCAVCGDDFSIGWCSDWSRSELRIVCADCFRELHPLIETNRW